MVAAALLARWVRARNDLPWNALAFKDWDHMVRIDIVAVG